MLRQLHNPSNDMYELKKLGYKRELKFPMRVQALKSEEFRIDNTRIECMACNFSKIVSSNEHILHTDG